MTREKAIETLINHTQYKCNGDDLIALDMAIEALEHPEQNVIAVVPCGDAISREDALMCLTGEIKETDTIETIIARSGRRIRKLPSVKPQESCDDAISRQADLINRQYGIDDSATLSTRDVVKIP